MDARKTQNENKLNWYHNNKDYYKKYRAEHKSVCKQTSRRWNLKNNFGITIDDYQKMFDSQQGKCAICKTHQSELKKNLCVDHCHDSKKVRGLLCVNCNLGLGKFNDKIELVESALNYLKVK